LATSGFDLERNMSFQETGFSNLVVWCDLIVQRRIKSDDGADSNENILGRDKWIASAFQHMHLLMPKRAG